MSDYTTTYVMRYLDNPMRFLFWTWDEALVIAVPFIMCLVANMMITGMCLSGALYFGYRWARSRLKAGVLSHLWYWYMPSGPMKTLPQSSKRQYLS